MPQVPDDLVKLADLMKEYKPSRAWWDIQIKNGHITAYKIPGERGLFVSESEVRNFMRPRPHVPGEEDASEGAS